jgi:hypothetical protein
MIDPQSKAAAFQFGYHKGSGKPASSFESLHPQAKRPPEGGLSAALIGLVIRHSI